MTAALVPVAAAAARPVPRRRRRYELRITEEIEVRDLVTGAVVRMQRLLRVQPLARA